MLVFKINEETDPVEVIFDRGDSVDEEFEKKFDQLLDIARTGHEIVFRMIQPDSNGISLIVMRNVLKVSGDRVFSIYAENPNVAQILRMVLPERFTIIEESTTSPDR